MQNVIFILALLLIGKGLSRLRAFPPETFSVLANFIIYVSLPALILEKIPGLSISREILAPIVLPWVMLAVSAAAVVGLSRTFRWSRETTGALLLVVPLGNTSFLGIPMVELFFGRAGVPYALLYDQLGTFLALATYGSIVVAFCAGAESPTAGRILRKVMTFPPFLAIIVALATRGLAYPPMVVAMLHDLGLTLVPVVMIAVGFRMALRLPRATLAPLGWGLGIKLVAAPLAALGFCRLAGWDSEAVRVSIIEAGMPPQITAGAVAIAAGLAPELVAALVGYGILVAFATLPVLYWLLG
ncbi:MAG TPA: AEC family transporter [Phycisphaerae bacterium]|nr:AEC family transporter [Phycisphaerales bacterium]HRX84945.1 AEC family transporter [Phycisphaerae bacterium]